MKTSVALCTYNGEKYIRQQLDSIFNQTRKPDEIIICDDRSKDNTAHIIEEYRDRDIALKLYVNENNLGFARNFRKCISLCSGDYIFLCDQDDVWEKTKVQELCDLMDHHPQIMSAVTNLRLIDTNGNFMFHNPQGENPFFNKDKWKIDSRQNDIYKVNLKAILSLNIGPGCAQVIRRDIVNEYMKLDSEFPHDYLLNVIAALHNGLYYYDVPLTRYRYHGNQAIGIPEYAITILEKNYFSIIKAYYVVFREFLYWLLVGDKDKIASFGIALFVNYIEKMNLTDDLQSQYLQWKKMAENRLKLYTKGPGRLKAFLKQGRYNKYWTFNYGFIEKLDRRLMDIIVLFRM